MLATVDAATELTRARERTVALLEPLTDEQLTTQVSPLMSPLVWDLAHIGHFEELWLLRGLGGQPPAHAEHDDVYDAFAHERSERGALPILAPKAAFAYIADVRERVLRLVDELDMDTGDPLLERGFVFGMVAQHELQHIETMTQTLQVGGLPGPAARPPRVTVHGEATVDGGPFHLGATGDDAWAYDNESPGRVVTLPSFRIDRAPVTNAEYAAFVADGGYRRDALWSADGVAWRDGEQADAPLYWERDGGGRWLRRHFDAVEEVADDEPVQHVSFHEAEAFARWAGRRLPTEAEWEKAARTCDDLELMQGGVWQWTSSTFGAYPGFRAFPYREYSEVFFGGDYRVLRGGAWPTDPLVARISFRNWDYPQRRQIFAGIRCACDD